MQFTIIDLKKLRLESIIGCIHMKIPVWIVSMEYSFTNINDIPDRYISVSGYN